MESHLLPNHPNADTQECDHNLLLAWASASASASISNLSLQRFPSQVSYHCIATLTGHTCYVSSLTLAGKGKFLYTGSSNNEIRAWRSHNEFHFEDQVSSVVAAGQGQGQGAVKCLIVLADQLFSAHQDHKIRVWKINRGREQQAQKCEHIATLPTLGDRILKLLNPNNQVQIRRHKTCTWVHHVDAVSALALSCDESLLYSVSWDRTIKIWRTSDFKCLESINGAHDDAINTVVVSKHGNVYTGSADKKIKVWKKLSGDKKHTLVTTLEKHNFGINALALDSGGCGSFLYSGACDKSIFVWKKNTNDNNMVVLGVLSGHTKAILCLAVSLDLICSGSADKTIRIWRVHEHENTYSCLSVLQGHLGPVKCLTIVFVDDPHGKCDTANYLVYSGGLDRDVKRMRIWGSEFGDPKVFDETPK
ncbi:hypothetical protein Dimus_023863 [Dionaea muscipula]